MNEENIRMSHEISFVTADISLKLEQGHNFFELAFIRSGSGKHYSNQSECDYHTGQLFLIKPENRHHFVIEDKTEFFFLRFNSLYLKKNNFSRDSLKRLEYILQNANHHNECILKNVVDTGFVPWAVEAIYKEQTVKDLYNQDMVHEMVNTIIINVARNIERSLPNHIPENTEQ